MVYERKEKAFPRYFTLSGLVVVYFYSVRSLASFCTLSLARSLTKRANGIFIFYIPVLALVISILKPAERFHSFFNLKIFWLFFKEYDMHLM